MRSFLSFFAGIAATFLFFDYLPHTHRPVHYHLEENGVLTAFSNLHRKNFSLNQSERPTVLISTSVYSVTQLPTLIKTAQAVYPVRSRVIWVIVLLPLSRSVESADSGMTADELNELNSFSQFINRNPEVEVNYWHQLTQAVSRFGVNSVILESNRKSSSWFGYETKRELELKAIIRGVEWAKANLPPWGQVVVLNGDYAIDSRLFLKLQRTTKRFACWPIGEILNTGISLASPLVDGDKNFAGFYDTSVKDLLQPDSELGQSNHVLLKDGGCSIDLGFLKKETCSSENVFKNLCKDLSVDKFDMIDKESIYVWHMKTYHGKWPAGIKVSVYNGSSNLRNLMNNSLGPRYKFMGESLLDINSIYAKKAAIVDLRAEPFIQYF